MRKRNAFLISGFLMIAIELFSLMIMPSYSAPPSYTVNDASVYASQMDGMGGGSGYANDTGQYEITDDIGVGNYTVTASANGYLDGKINTTVTSIDDVKEVTFYLSRSAVIWGKVIGFDSHPVIGAQVSLRKNGTGSWITSAMTDLDGKYCFATDIPTGVYYAMVEEFEFPYPGYSHEYVPRLDVGYVGGKASSAVSATAGSVAQASDVVLEESGVITGTVKNTGGDPLPYASVSGLNKDTWHYQSISADANGVYRFAYDVTTAVFSLQSSFSGYVGQEIDVNATQGGTVVQNLTILHSASVHGAVLRTSDDRPIPDVSVSFYSTSYTYYASTSTDANGTYAVNWGLGPENYTVMVNLGMEMMNTTDITLSEGEDLTLDFKGNAFFISGTVYNSTMGGDPIDYPDVSLDFEGGFMGPPGGEATGDQNGVYSMVVPVRGGDEGNDYLGTFQISAYGYNTSYVNSTITIGTDVVDMNFVLYPRPVIPPQPSAKIIGTVYGYAGSALPFSHQAWYMISGNYTFIVEFNSTSDITYAYGSVFGGYVNVFLWGDSGTAGEMTLWIPKQYFPGPTFTVTSYPPPNPTPTLTSNSTHWKIDITYTHSSRTLSFQSESVIPEYPMPTLMIAVMMAGAAATLLERKRRQQKLR